MTTHILRIDSSLFSEQGVSTRLNNVVIDQLKANLGEVEVTHRDLGRHPLPHFSAETIGAIGTAQAQRDAAQNALATMADELIAEVQNAHILVVAAPMYNFGIPSGLKAWLDYIARAGVTFRYTENGPEGLLHNKTVYVVTARGGVYRDKPADTQVPYLRSFFQFLGISDIRVIYAEGVNMGQKEQSMKQAEHAISQAIQAERAA